MNDEEFKEFILKSLLRILENRLEDLQEMKAYNGRLDKEILDTINDINRYRKMLKELK